MGLTNTEKLMTIEATQVLELFHRTTKLGAQTSVCKEDKGYRVKINHDWREANDFYINEVFITNNNESSGEEGDYGLGEVNDMLGEELERQIQREFKEQKRKALIASLTPEQRELLGVK